MTFTPRNSRRSAGARASPAGDPLRAVTLSVDSAEEVPTTRAVDPA